MPSLFVMQCVACAHCPWDDERDAKEDDWSDVPDKFSRKQLRNATILVLRRQKPSTNALGGLYLQCVDHMLEARWVEGCAVPLPRLRVSDGKVSGASLHPRWCRFSPHGEVA